MPDLDRFIAQTKLPELLGIDRRTIARLRERGQFPPARQISGRRVGFLESELRQWMTDRPLANDQPVWLRQKQEVKA